MDLSSAHSHLEKTAERCTEMLKTVSDFWVLEITRVLRDGDLRFCEIERALAGVNPVTLTSRLKKMEETGLVTRIEESHNKLSVAYALTEKGRGLLPVLSSVETFANQFGS